MATFVQYVKHIDTGYGVSSHHYITVLWKISNLDRLVLIKTWIFRLKMEI